MSLSSAACFGPAGSPLLMMRGTSISDHQTVAYLAWPLSEIGNQSPGHQTTVLPATAFCVPAAGRGIAKTLSTTE
jgi:hypothetical protein